MHGFETCISLKSEFLSLKCPDALNTVSCLENIFWMFANDGGKHIVIRMWKWAGYNELAKAICFKSLLTHKVETVI